MDPNKYQLPAIREAKNLSKCTLTNQNFCSCTASRASSRILHTESKDNSSRIPTLLNRNSVKQRKGKTLLLSHENFFSSFQFLHVIPILFYLGHQGNRKASSKNSYLGSSGMFSTSGIFDKADIQQLSLLEGKIATQVITT